MAKIEVAIKDAIARGARKQIRSVATPLRRDVRRLRQAVRELRTQLAAFREVAARWQQSDAGRRWQPAVSEDEARAARLSPGLIQKLRRRLALSQASMARLVGVSPAAVMQWERGRATPVGKNRAAIVGLRQLGRRQARQLLAATAAVRGSARRRAAPRRRRASRVRRRSDFPPGRRARPGRARSAASLRQKPSGPRRSRADRELPRPWFGLMVGAVTGRRGPARDPTP